MNTRAFCWCAAMVICANAARCEDFKIRISHLTNKAVLLNFPTSSNKVYEVLYSTNLLEWHVFKTLRAQDNHLSLVDTQAAQLPHKYFSASDVSQFVVVEGYVRTPDGWPVPYVIVSNTVDETRTHTDLAGHYLLRTWMPNAQTSFPFRLDFLKGAFRPYSALVSNVASARLDYMSLQGAPNNDFSNRMVLSLARHGGRTDNASCDREAGEQGEGERSLWYSFTPPADGTLRVIAGNRGWYPNIDFFTGSQLQMLHLRPPAVYSTSYDSGRLADVSVYRGEELQIRIAGQGTYGTTFNWSSEFIPDFPLYLNPFGPLAGRATASPLPNSEVTGRYLPGTLVTLSALTNYGYKFVGWSGSLTNTNQQITVRMDGIKRLTANFRVVNDNFADAFVLQELPAVTYGLNAYATTEFGEPVQVTSSVWWRWTAPSNMSVELYYDPTNVPSALSVYTGNTVSSLTPVANNTHTRNKRLVGFDAIGGTTYHIAVANGQSFSFPLALSNVFEARYVLSWEMQGNGVVSVDPPLDGNGQFGAGETVSLNAQPVGPYEFVSWDDLSFGQAVPLSTNNPVSITLHSDRRLRANFRATNAVPLNDHFANRTCFVGESTYWYNRTNSLATRESGEPFHAGGTGTRSLWWSWTAERSSDVALTRWSISLGFNPIVAVYTGTALTNLNPVASGWRSTNVVTFAADAGTTYHIAVDGYDNSAGTVWFTFAVQR